jgi:hypothetical protein
MAHDVDQPVRRVAGHMAHDVDQPVRRVAGHMAVSPDRITGVWSIL